MGRGSSSPVRGGMLFGRRRPGASDLIQIDREGNALLERLRTGLEAGNLLKFHEQATHMLSKPNGVQMLLDRLSGTKFSRNGWARTVHDMQSYGLYNVAQVFEDLGLAVGEIVVPTALASELIEPVGNYLLSIFDLLLSEEAVMELVASGVTEAGSTLIVTSEGTQRAINGYEQFLTAYEKLVMKMLLKRLCDDILEQKDTAFPGLEAMSSRVDVTNVDRVAKAMYDCYRMDAPKSHADVILLGCL
jgi:hypothetical protein